MISKDTMTVKEAHFIIMAMFNDYDHLVNASATERAIYFMEKADAEDLKPPEINEMVRFFIELEHMHLTDIYKHLSLKEYLKDIHPIYYKYFNTTLDSGVVEHIPEMTINQAIAVITQMFNSNKNLQHSNIDIQTNIDIQSLWFQHMCMVLDFKAPEFEIIHEFFTELNNLNAEFSIIEDMEDSIKEQEYQKRLNNIYYRYFIPNGHGFFEEKEGSQIKFPSDLDIRIGINNIRYEENADSSGPSFGTFTVFYQGNVFDVKYNCYKTKPVTIGIHFQANITGATLKNSRTISLKEYLEIINNEYPKSTLDENRISSIISVLTQIINGLAKE